MNFVMDACSMIAYLRGESGSEVIVSILMKEENRCIAHAINLCEVYYDFIRAQNEETARGAIADLQATGIITTEDMDSSFWQEAGKFKAKGKISLADCFAIALAIRENATLLTSDHHEFDPIIENGTCPVPVHFIR